MLGATVSSYLDLVSISPSILLLVALASGAALGFVAYQIWFHPLASFPGPISYKITSLPLILQCRSGDRHLQLLRDHERYGDVVRIAPNFLSFSSEEALNAIYGSISVNVRKSDWYLVLDSATGDFSTFSEIDKELHRVRRNEYRKTLGLSFQSKEGEDSLIGMIDDFCDVLKPEKGQKWSGSHNMNELAGLLGLDIVSDIGYGAKFDAMSKDNKKMHELSKSLIPAFGFFYWVTYLPFAEKFLPTFLLSAWYERLGGLPARQNNILIAESISAVLNAPPNTRSFIHHFSQIRPNLRQETLFSESLSLINAGADPFSAHIAATFFYLCHNPSTLAKLASELRSTFDAAGDIRSGTRLNSCVYLRAVIDEVWRRAPPILSPLPRLVLPGGLAIPEHPAAHTPAGTVVGVPIFVIHHNPKYFPEPYTFAPERWLEGSPLKTEGARRAFSPFGKGIRQCVAIQVAYLWASLTIARLVWRFDLRLAEGLEKVGGGAKGRGWGKEREDEFQFLDRMAPERQGPWVQFCLRKDL